MAEKSKAEKKEEMEGKAESEDAEELEEEAEAEETEGEALEGETASATETGQGAGGGEKPRKKRKEKKAVKKRKSRKEKENPLARAVRMAVETGKAGFGAKTGVKDALLAKAKLIVVASNAPRELQDDVNYYSRLSSIPVLAFEGTSMELGSICGKPYPVSVLSVYDAGSSGILEIAKTMRAANRPQAHQSSADFEKK